MLDEHDELKHIEIIGVGGVSDRAGFERMKSAGAAAVGVATALGVEGVDVFEKILKCEEGVKVRQEVMVEDQTREDFKQEGREDIKQEGREDIKQEGREDIKPEGEGEGSRLWRESSRLRERSDKNRKRKSDHLE